jgi:hypothetical protein
VQLERVKKNDPKGAQRRRILKGIGSTKQIRTLKKCWNRYLGPTWPLLGHPGAPAQIGHGPRTNRTSLLAFFGLSWGHFGVIWAPLWCEQAIPQIHGTRKMIPRAPKEDEYWRESGQLNRFEPRKSVGIGMCTAKIKQTIHTQVKGEHGREHSLRQVPIMRKWTPKLT